MQSWPSKDPDEVLDFSIDWDPDDNPCLEAGEAIVSYTFTVVSGDVVKDSQERAGAVTTVWLSGGTDGTSSVITCEIETDMGRVYDQTMRLRIRSH